MAAQDPVDRKLNDFFKYVVLQHRQGDSALQAGEGWMAAAHAIRAYGKWGKAGEEIASKLETTFLEEIHIYKTDKWRKAEAEAEAKQQNRRPPLPKPGESSASPKSQRK